MKVRRLVLGVAVALCFGATVKASIIIPTNLNGADTEIREFELNATALAPTVVATQQRGANNELATRGQETTITATNDRSSIMYMKFDISGLPNHTANPGFWADKKLFFRGYVRNTNLSDSRIAYPNIYGPVALVNFDIRGLEPGHVYADDNPSAANRTDQSGLAYSSPHYEYNWDEGTGTGGSGTGLGTGITFIDAPGITPFCTLRGSCDTATFGGLNTDIHQSLGLYDNFNSDTRFLGNWQWKRPTYIFAGSNRYPIGMELEYADANGNLQQLVFDAQDAGRTSVTLMLNLAVDTRLDTSSNPGAGIVDGPNPGIFPANTFLNFNYLFNPKDKTTLDNDNAFDPDGGGPGVATGSPYSCDGSTGPGLTNCPGHTLGDNSTGKFSPQLIVRIPEPTSMVLLALGSLALTAARRRK